MQELGEPVLKILAYLGGGGLIAVGVLRWAGDRLAERLERSWQQQHERQLEALKSELATRQLLLQSGSSTISAAYLGVQEQRIQAVAALWQAVLDARGKHAVIVGVMDMIPAKYLEKKRLRNLFPAPDVTSLLRQRAPDLTAMKKVETHRPFLSEKLWLLLQVYCAFENRVLVDVTKSLERDEKLKSIPEVVSPSKDSPRSLLQGVLTEDELSYIDALYIGHFQGITKLLETKILAASREHLAGGEGSELGLREALRLHAELAKTQGELGGLARERGAE